MKGDVWYFGNQAALSIDEAKGWFCDALGVAPADDDLIPFVQLTNEYLSHDVFWKACHGDKHLDVGPDAERMARIGTAIEVLLTDLPIKIADTVRAGESAELTIALLANLEAHRVLIKQKRTGRRREKWHAVAQHLRPMIADAARSLGKKAGFGKPDGTGVLIIQKTLNWLHMSDEPNERESDSLLTSPQFTNEAIVEALRPHRDRRKVG